MSQLTSIVPLTNIEPLMSSVEVANLTGKRHDNVRADIRKMGAELSLTFQEKQIPTDGRPVMAYLLTKEQSLCLVSGYNAVLRMAIIRRWQALEQCQAPAFPQIPQSFAEALQLAANQARQLEEQAPKVEFFDRLVDKQTLMTASQVAQKHGLSAVKLNRFLDELRVYNHGVKRCRVFRQWFIDKGLGAMRQTEQGFSQALFTTAGEAWVCEKLISEGAAA